jgi:hypothetical protein
MTNELSGDAYNYAAFDGGPAQGDFDAFTGTTHVGAHAPDSSLAALDGSTVTLASLWAATHVVMEFGSYT